MSDEALVTATTDLARRSCAVEADMLACLGEIDSRRLYLDRAYDSMFAFCVGELGFSEDAAFNRIAVARRARELPAMIDALRSRRIHLAGLRLLAPHLDESNHRELLAQAAGKTKRQIEELVAKHFPQPLAPTVVRKLPQASLRLSAGAAPSDIAVCAGMATPPSQCATPAIPQAAHRPQRQAIAPLAEDAFKIQFTASRAFRDKLREAQDLMSHRFPDGDLGAILGAALELLVERVNKERFGVGRKARKGKPRASVAPGRAVGDAPVRDRTVGDGPMSDGPMSDGPVSAGPVSKPAAHETPPADALDNGAAAAWSRHVPAETARAVFLRDGGQCTFVDARGRRCCATRGLQIDHIDGFARTHSHDVDRLRLLCRAHNLHAAARMYGRAFMARARRSKAHAPVPGRVTGPRRPDERARGLPPDEGRSS